MGYLFLVLAIFLIVVNVVNVRKSGGQKKNAGKPQEKRGYPYQPNVECRLPDGRITTHGYAAVHPELFAHWQFGPEGVYVENIDRDDWENWRITYYGM